MITKRSELYSFSMIVHIQTVTIKDLDLSVEFEAQEDLLTEISAKFTTERVE